MRHSRIAKTIAGAAVMALAITGCSGGEDAEGGDSATEAGDAADGDDSTEAGDDSTDAGDDSAAEGGGAVRLALSQDMESLLPGDSNFADPIAVLDVVYDGLVRYDPETTEPYNYVAESIETEDNQVWTITTKEGLEFHNGEPVDAAAFARSWNETAYGPNGRANNWFFGNIEGYDAMQGEEDDEGNITVEPEATELSGLEIVDDRTLRVTLTAPFAGWSTLLGYTGFFPMAQECVDDIDACATQPIGNGPFQVEQWEQGVSLTATKWADYALDESPSSYDAIEWTEYPGGSTWADFQAGDLDFSEPDAAQYEAALADSELAERYIQIGGSALTYIAFPMYADGPWQDIEFRKAISMAIDRQGIIDALAAGQATPADSWVVPGGVPGGEAGTCQWCTFDPDAAQAALEAAGGWPEGETMTISLGDDEAEIEYFKAIGDSIEQVLGIPYELNPTPDYFATRADQGFDGPFRANWFPDYPLNENYLSFYAVGEAGAGNFGWYSEEFENKLAEGNQAATLDEAVALYQEAEAILAQEFPTIPFRWNAGATFHSEGVSNVVLDPFSSAVKLRLLEVNDG